MSCKAFQRNVLSNLVGYDKGTLGRFALALLEPQILRCESRRDV